MTLKNVLQATIPKSLLWQLSPGNLIYSCSWEPPAISSSLLYPVLYTFSILFSFLVNIRSSEHTFPSFLYVNIIYELSSPWFLFYGSNNSKYMHLCIYLFPDFLIFFRIAAWKAPVKWSFCLYSYLLFHFFIFLHPKSSFKSSKCLSLSGFKFMTLSHVGDLDMAGQTLLP